jgi:carbon-monoxide dehydrogenase large subunit
VRLTADMGAYLQLITPGIPLLGAFLYAGVYDLPKAYDFSCTGGVHQPHPDRRLPRRRSPRGHLRHRAGDGRAGEARSAPTPSSSGAATSSARSSSRTRRSPAWSTTPATTTRRPDRGRLIDYAGVRARQAEQNVEGSTKRLGLGVSSYFEMCGLAPSRVLASLNYSAGGWEAATVRVLPTSKVQVVTGTAPHGQGHETSWSMIVADKFGIDPADVDVLHSDTAIAPLGLDTYGSRSLPVGGVAVGMACDKVIDKARRSRPTRSRPTSTTSSSSAGVPGRGFTRQGDAAGRHRLRGVHRPRPARRDRTEPRGTGHLRPTELLVAVRHPHVRVEIDTETGDVDVLQYVAVDDCGNQVNPMIVEGQVHGGVVQGLAQALYEGADTTPTATCARPPSPTTSCRRRATSRRSRSATRSPRRRPTHSA